jgi:hypothetical protein
MSVDQNLSEEMDQNSSDGSNQNDNSSNASGKQTLDDKVKYSTYQKVLAEKKSMQEKYQSMTDKLAQMENEKLSAEGKKDELIKRLTEERDGFKQKLTGSVKAFARQITSGQVKQLATQMGCVDSDAILALYQDKIDAVETDDNFNLSTDAVKAVLEEAKQQKPYLFQKASPKLDTGANAGAGDIKEKAKDYSKMSADELKKEIDKIDKLEGRSSFMSFN